MWLEIWLVSLVIAKEWSHLLRYDLSPMVCQEGIDYLWSEIHVLLLVIGEDCLHMIHADLSPKVWRKHGMFSKFANY